MKKSYLVLAFCAVSVVSAALGHFVPKMAEPNDNNTHHFSVKCTTPSGKVYFNGLAERGFKYADVEWVKNKKNKITYIAFPSDIPNPHRFVTDSGNEMFKSSDCKANVFLLPWDKK